MYGSDIDSSQQPEDGKTGPAERTLAGAEQTLAHDFSRDVRRRAARDRLVTARARLEEADRRDALAHARDRAAIARAEAAAQRHRKLARLEDAVGRDDEEDGSASTAAEMILGAVEQRMRAARYRAKVAEHRALDAIDREAAARDREQSARDRLESRADREALAQWLAVSETDSLTGARTRAAGLSDLEREVERCRRSGSALVVAYIDVIGLKAVNDSRGHSAGDALLKDAVALIKTHLRPYDLVVRLGGDEFLCAMSGMTASGAHKRFDTIAAGLPAGNAAGAIRTGFAELQSRETANELVARADAELVAGLR